MEKLVNIEFFKAPDGCVMYRRQGEPVLELSECDREIVGAVLTVVRTRYPEAFKALSELYSRSEQNRAWYEFRMVSRFIRCNLGSFDTQSLDIDADGLFHFEQVQCPLMGTDDCRFERVICCPTLASGLTTRELELLPLFAEGLQSWQIAERMFISKVTVDHHRQNILLKLGLHNTTELAAYYYGQFKPQQGTKTG